MTRPPKVRRVTWLKVGAQFQAVLDGHWVEGDPPATVWHDSGGIWCAFIKHPEHVQFGPSIISSIPAPQAELLATHFANGNAAKAFAAQCLLGLQVQVDLIPQPRRAYPGDAIRARRAR